MPSATFSHTATSPASAETVWAALDTPAAWEGIPGVDRVFDPVIDEAGRLRGFSFETRAGGRRYLGRATPHVRVEGEAMGWHVESPEVRGVIRVDLSPLDSGTSVTVGLEVESAGMISGMFFPMIARAIGDGLPDAVGRFAAGLGDRV